MTRGLFDKTAVDVGWFDETAQPVGWFDETLLDATAGGISYALSGAAGSYTLTGNAAAFKVAHTLAGSAGAYSLTGNAATLSYAPGSGAYSLTGASGSYTLTGNAASFMVGRNLQGASGSYTLTGRAATLTYTPGSATQNYTLTGDAGSYVLTGRNATFDYSGEVITVITGGGIPRKKPKYINNREDIERIVATEIERVLNPVIEQAKPIEKPVIQQKVEQALVVNPQLKKSLELAIAEANRQINEYMEELDDEEAIFYLYG